MNTRTVEEIKQALEDNTHEDYYIILNYKGLCEDLDIDEESINWSNIK